MMKNIFFLLLLAGLTFMSGASAWGQQTANPPTLNPPAANQPTLNPPTHGVVTAPKRSFEPQRGKILKDSGLQKLGVFIGTWESEYPDSANGKSSVVYKWSPRGNFLIAEHTRNDHGALMSQLSVYGYQQRADEYTETW